MNYSSSGTDVKWRIPLHSSGEFIKHSVININTHKYMHTHISSVLTSGFGAYCQILHFKNMYTNHYMVLDENFSRHYAFLLILK